MMFFTILILHIGLLQIPLRLHRILKVVLMIQNRPDLVISVAKLRLMNHFLLQAIPIRKMSIMTMTSLNACTRCSILRECLLPE